MVNVAFLLDITGSMGSEIEGVKQTVASLVEAIQDIQNDSPLEDFNLRITVITFTESTKGCYVSNHSFVDGLEAVSFVKSIQFCSPPNDPHVKDAYGGDGPENHKAALFELTKLDPEECTIAFLITDAEPHMLNCTLSSEANQEIQYLARSGVNNTDYFHILQTVQDHFGDNLIMSTILYGGIRPMYGPTAKMFNGALLVPRERTSSVLCRGLLVIFNQMMQSFLGEEPDRDTIEEPEGFDFYDVTTVKIPTTENELQSSIKLPKAKAKDALFSLIDRATVIVGDRFNKRALGATSLLGQIELLLLVAKFLVSRDSTTLENTRSQAKVLLEQIDESLLDGNRGHFKLNMDVIESILTETPPKMEASDKPNITASAISLQTIEEVIKELGSADEDPHLILKSVANLFLSHLAVLTLPMKNGRLDFMDAWSSVVPKITNDIVSAGDFLDMIGEAQSTKGLSTRDEQINYAQIFASPDDLIGSAILRAASGTQVLNVLTALLAGAPAGKFAPNMYAGTACASLMFLLWNEMSEYQWQIARKLVHSIEVLMGGKADDTNCNPEDALGKILYRLLRLNDKMKYREGVREFIEEAIALRVQLFAKNCRTEYLDLIEVIMDYKHEGPTHKVVMMELADIFLPHPLENPAFDFGATNAITKMRSSSLKQTCDSFANRILALLLPGQKLAVDDIWPEYSESLTKLLFLQKRKERYTLERPTDNTKHWLKTDELTKSLCDTAYQLRAASALQEKYEVLLRDLRQRRAQLKSQKNILTAFKTAKKSLKDFLADLMVVGDDSKLQFKLIARALKDKYEVMDKADYHAKVKALVTGRVWDTTEDGSVANEKIIFNRGNLHAHPDHLFPLGDDLVNALRDAQRKFGWPLSHTYRPSKPNHSGHSNENPSSWAIRRSHFKKTFWMD